MFESLWMMMLLSLSQVGTAPHVEAVVEQARRNCGVDTFEPNDVRRRAKRVKGEGITGRLCATDTDWFWMEIPRGVRVEVVLEHAEGLAFRAPQIFPPRARKPRGRAGKRPGQTFTRYRAAKGGRHRIRLDGRGEHGRDYRLVLREL